MSRGRHRDRKGGGAWFWPVTLVVAGLAVPLRVLPSLLRPGYDVDESVYHRIAVNFARHFSMNDIHAQPEYIRQSAPLYTSHPPFPFMVEGVWLRVFGPGMTQVRVLAVVASIVTLVLLAGFLRRLVGDWAIVPVALIAFDGWITFTNRVGWLENMQFVLGIAALWFYHYVSKRHPTRGWLFTAGLALTAVFVFKHVGLYFLLTACVHRVITTPRRERKPPPTGSWCRRWWTYLGRGLWAFPVRPLLSPLVLAFVALTAVYVAGMVVWAGTDYVQATLHQLQRITGSAQSRGVVKTSDVLHALLHQYGIFVATVAVMAFAGIMVGVRVLQCLLPWSRRSLEPTRRVEPMLFAWALTAFGAFGLLGLKLPHYLFLIMLPAYCYAVAEMKRWVQKRRQLDPQGDRLPERTKFRPLAVAALCAVLAVSGVYATYNRVVVHKDNAVLAAVTFIDTKTAPDAHVVADEFVGNLITRPYCQITHARLCFQVAGDPDYVVTYTTTTQKLPISKTIDRWLAPGYSMVVARFTGFKETIVIYKILDVARQKPPQ